jgi:amino acid permease
VGYLYFVAMVFDTVICIETNGEVCNNKTEYKLLMLIVTIPLSLLKTYTYLSYVSMLGIACALVGAFLMIGYCGDRLAKGDTAPGEMKVFDVTQFFGYIGIAMFSFEGNGIVINLQAEAKNKGRYPALLRWAVFTIIIWYMILSTVCYATFKKRAETVDYVTQLLPINAFTISIMLLFCANALTSYPVQILCLYEIIEDLSFFNNKADSALSRNIKVLTERIILILIVTAVAILIPKFVDFLNIAGSLGSATLGFIFPPLYYIQSVGGMSKLKWYDAGFNIFLIAFGGFGAVFSLYNSISNLT